MSDLPALSTTSPEGKTLQPALSGKENFERDSHPSWQPIETAPRVPLCKMGYGPEVMLFVDDRPGFGYWDRDFDKFYVEHPEAHRGEPTHWMPLPEPPK